MEFRILGDLEVHAEGLRVDVGHARQRAVLAVLLFDLGRVVPTSQLIDKVWGDDPPVSVRNVLYGYVAKLRAAIAGGGDPAVALSRRSGGYRLDADQDRVDLHRFRRLAAEASTAGDDERASVLLASALALWRGSALAGMDSPWLSAIRDSVELERRTAVLDLADIRLRQGHHQALISSLVEEAVTCPADERLIGQLMLALYWSGRQAEALQRFEQTRRWLAEEFGADPGSELRALHQRILRADPSLTTPRAASRDRAGPEPRQLPADVPAFTGRTGELAELNSLLPAAASAAAIWVIEGTAGVGKTALAVHWAHQAVGQFPDGQLYVNLHGCDPGQPITAAGALAGFLRSLGVPGQDIPPEAEERASLYRSLLAGKRMLIVLDNAGSADQVRPLLPGTPACPVVVTSRNALAGLAARDGATRLDLDLLPLEEAVALLRTLVGTRLDAEPGVAAELAVQCCRLPLALRVTAELAATRPAVPLAGLAGELADLRTRLDLLVVGGDRHAEVRTVFSWSYRHLDADAAQAFRLLGLHPGPDFDPYAIAALTGTTVEQARRAVDTLARAHLLSRTAPGRHGMHDLLRCYARELAASLDTGQRQREALTRLLDHYLHAAAAAMDTLFPAERHRRPRVPRPATPVPPLASRVAAREWLNRERGTLVTAAAHAAACDWPGHAIQLAATLARYLRNGGHIPEAVTLYGHALGAAGRTGDRIAKATVLNEIGLVNARLCRFQQAGDRHRQALTLFRQAGDRVGEARALSNIGLAETHLDHYEHAARHQQQAVTIFRDTGDRFGEARSLSNLGGAWQMRGRYQTAAGHFQQALGLCRDIGDREGEAYSLARLGIVRLRLGQCQQATGQFQQALALFHEMGHTVGEAETLVKLGEAHLGLDRHEEAAANLERALAISRKLGDLGMEADALNGLGEVLLRTGHSAKAREHHVAALQLASEVGKPREQARAHSGLARACQADGDSLAAQYHWQEAHVRYTAINAPEARETRAHLAITDPW